MSGGFEEAQDEAVSADLADSTSVAEDSEGTSSDAVQITSYDMIRIGDNNQIRERFIEDSAKIFIDHSDVSSSYLILFMCDTEGRISPWNSNQIYDAISMYNRDQSRNILLLVESPGGGIESAYQISKMCREFSNGKFIVCVPRQAKSAATLMALGADEIHMGPLGELGPIDPQLGGLPALGVAQALERIARLSHMYPGSSEMFSRYLRATVTVEQIGYCERLGDSAVQYAERLISTKEDLRSRSNEIARKLVYEYKDHSFVIDREEARLLFNNSFIVGDSPELRFAEEYYRLMDYYALFLGYLRNKQIRLVGASRGVWIWDKPAS